MTSEEKDKYYGKWLNWTRQNQDKNPKPSPFFKECLKRLKNYHKTKHSFDPTYLTDDFREFRIKQTPEGRWKVVPYGGGPTPKEVAGIFTSFRLAEQRLVNWIKRYNKGYARYPGCPKPRPTNSTELFLKDWSPKPAP